MKAAGFALAALTDFEMTWDAVPFDALEAEAAGRMTEGEWRKWSVKGFLEGDSAGRAGGL